MLNLWMIYSIQVLIATKYLSGLGGNVKLGEAHCWEAII